MSFVSFVSFVSSVFSVIELAVANETRSMQDPPNDNPSRTTLALLAGGAGTRMGLPKSRLTLAGLPILQYLHTRFNWPGPTLLITAPGFEKPPASHLFTREAPDPVAGLGPLRGILTALESAETDIVVITTVDMPNVSPTQLYWLSNQLASRPESLAIMLRPAGVDSPIEPFPSAFRRSDASLIASRLSAGHRSVQQLAQNPAITLLTAPSDWPASTWLNLNTPEDLATFFT